VAGRNLDRIAIPFERDLLVAFHNAFRLIRQNLTLRFPKPPARSCRGSSG